MSHTAWHSWYGLFKPGIVYGNALTVIAGYLFASRWHLIVARMLAVLVGSSLVMAGACAFNNVLDRRIDARMERTRQRALVTRAIPVWQALLAAAAVSALGLLLLTVYVNRLTFWLGALALVSYVLFYGYAKRHSVHGTLAGCLPGALPLVAGYTAVSERLTAVTGLLFVVMVLWQLPHFYAIALYRLQDYTRAGLPVMPRRVGTAATRLQIMLYIALFVLACAAFTALGYAGYTFLAVMIAAGSWWLWRGVRGYRTADPDSWARSMFGASLVVVLVLSAALSVGSRLA